MQEVRICGEGTDKYFAVGLFTSFFEDQNLGSDLRVKSEEK